jgi:signal transduction histidine kinase
MTRRWLAAAVTFLLAATAAPVHAVDLRDVLADYTLTSWSRKDGLTGPVWTFAQDADGFLWLGNDEGLVRFDGVRFTVWNPGGALPKLPVRSLRVASDGTLWIGFGGTGGIARIAHRAATTFTGPSAPTGSIASIVEDRAHTIWAAGASGLYHFAGDRWEKLGPEHGLPAAAITGAYVDSSGTLWIGTAAGLFWRPEATEERFQEIERSNDPLRGLSFSEDSTGRIWTNDPVVGYRKLGDESPPEGAGESGRGYRLLHDRDGNLWVGTIGQGLWRVRHPESPVQPPVERTTVLSGLSSDAVRSVFEDRDGNIWAGTTEGVDRLMPHRVTPWTGLGLVSTIDVTRDDRMLVGTADGLLRFLRTAGSWQPDRARIPLGGVRAVRTDPQGHVWALARDDLFRVVSGRPVHVALPTGSVPIDAIAAVHDGGLFAIARDGTVIRDNGTVASTFGHVTDLENARVTTAFADRTGRLWVAYAGSSIGVLQPDGRFTSYAAQQGLSGGPHYGIYEDGDGAIWIGGSDGLSRFAHDRFTSITRANGLPQGGVYAVSDDDQRFLWLATSAGILRLSREQFDAGVMNAQQQLHFRSYDTSDGLAGFPTALSDRSAVRAGDGSIWFVTSRGLSVVQPRSLVAGHRTPPVMVEAVEADDRVLDATAASLPPGTGKLQIDYTAPDVTTPLKVRFRYRLEGFDADWIDAGARRQALYRDLPPRRYKFRVAVSDDEGRWSESEAAWDFTIEPRFYQTLWFYVLCAAAAGALVWGAWAWRLQQLRRQFALVLGERVRVSRELHDTLLQSLVGIALEFDAIAKSLDSSPDAARDRVVKMRERVEEYIREARRSIWSLRSPALETRDLVAALRESGTRAAAGQPVAFEFDVSGTPRRYTSNLEHQLLRIGQEAVLNAVRHAKARTVKMTLQYSDAGVALRVADDGAGFEPGRAGGGTTDHYGITTMRERAEQVGGRVTITSRPDGGTVVEAIVPTSVNQIVNDSMNEDQGAA